eukprot:TRINITY_DN7974_c0_g1_i8.p1 TRINITY_DN7974_c0_g1~~TRINITY_DN7974_c0_g1_i8.p1  ORF type:complete len:268 (+),score=16.63 TRINITY_DN7974_c0_g1_i8:97-900(+)
MCIRDRIKFIFSANMDKYAFDKRMLETLIRGLKNSALAKLSKEARIEALYNMYELYLLRQREEKTRLMKKNCAFPLFNLPDSTIIKSFLCCFDLKDINAISFVSRRFYELTKTNGFLYCYVKNYERTHIKVNLNAFGNSRKGNTGRKVAKQNKEEINMETQKKINALLEAKLKTNDDKIKELKSSITILQELIENEKTAKAEAIKQADSLENKLKVVEEEWNVKGARLSQSVTELESKVCFMLTHIAASKELCVRCSRKRNCITQSQ